MNKIFLFVWLVTLPMAICHSKSDLLFVPVSPMMVIFIITFGFLGLEIVSMELSDPFGDDPSDFDELGEASFDYDSNGNIDCGVSIFNELSFFNTSSGRITFPVDFDILSPLPSTTKPWDKMLSKGALPLVPQDSNSEE